jgi:hypothetical protein
VDKCKPLPDALVVHQLAAQQSAQVVPAQVDIESKTRKQFFMSQVQSLSSRRFQRGSDRVNLHCLTRLALTAATTV